MIRAALLAAGAAGLSLVAACSTGPVATGPTPTPSGSPASLPVVTPSPTATASPTPTPTPTPTSPLTGLPAAAPQPVLVVKLDNTGNAQPHAGLAKADVVYLEEVEYGLTRIAAVFSSRVPSRIGPVRSARITDVDLIAQYGRPAFAYSGAQSKLYPVLDAADFHDVSPRRGAEGYSRDFDRPAPYNYFLDGTVALERAPRASVAHDIGFRFDEAVPAGGLVATKVRMAWAYSTAAFRYDPETGSYAVELNDRRAEAEENARGQNADTVVIQYVRQRPSAYYDRGGGNTPHAETIGTGKAVVLRDGRAWPVTWTRPRAQDGTVFTLADGSVLPFKPGQTWVVLLDKQRPATVKPMTSAASATPSSQ